MKLIILPVVFLALYCAAFGQPAPTTDSRNADQEAVHKVVDEIVAAIDRNVADAFDRLSTADYTFVNPAGKVWNKSQYWS